jgi:YesN/AraC family two-component response regulator
MERGRIGILVVDDEKIQRENVSDAIGILLKREIPSFDNARDAWQYILNNHADILMLISDVDMPDMNGFDLLKNVKDLFPDIICVMMSGKKDNLQPALELRAERFILKPFWIEDFIRVVEKYIVSEE